MSTPLVAGLTLGLNALSTGQKIAAASAERRLSGARNRLELAQAKRETEQRLAEGLARQNAVAGARGVAPSSGSLMREAMAARRAAERTLASARARAGLADADAALRRRGRVAGSLIDFARSGITHGATIYNSLK